MIPAHGGPSIQCIPKETILKWEVSEDELFRWLQNREYERDDK